MELLFKDFCKELPQSANENEVCADLSVAFQRILEKHAKTTRSRPKQGTGLKPKFDEDEEAKLHGLEMKLSRKVPKPGHWERDVFLSFANNGGEISRSDFTRALQSLNLVLQPGEFALLLRGKKSVNGKDFLQRLDESKKISDLEMMIDMKLMEHGHSYRDLFLTYDIDKQGHLTRSEFKNAAAELGIRLTSAEFDLLYRKHGLENKAGGIDYNEFLRIFTRSHAYVPASTSQESYLDTVASPKRAAQLTDPPAGLPRC